MEQQNKNLPKLPLQTSEKRIKYYKDNCTLSVYDGELTTKCVIDNTAKVKTAFPSLPKEFYMLFQSRIKDKDFTNERLTDAVNHVIDNCIYPTPTIAQFLSFDKSIVLYSYAQMLKMNNENRDTFKMYKSVDVGKDKPMYASLSDIKEYDLKLWISSPNLDSL